MYALFYSLDPTGKSLKDGVVPSSHLRKKSISAAFPPPHSAASIIKREESTSSTALPSSTPMAVYKGCSKFQKCISMLSATISSKDIDYVHPKLEIFVEPSLGFSLEYFGWILFDDHNLYRRYERSLANVTLPSLLQEIEQFLLCEGVDIPDPIAI